MARKPAKRENGRGTIEASGSKSKPFKAKINVGSKIGSNGKRQVVYKSLGNYATRREAEEVLLMYSKCPYDLSDNVKTFSQLYDVWSVSYFKSLSSPASIRTITSSYNYCSALYDMPLNSIGAGHIKDVMENGYIIVDKGKDKGKKRFASICTRERIKSLCNLMFDYALERRLIQVNPARSFNVGYLRKQIEDNAKKKIPFTPSQIKELWKYWDQIPFADMVLIGIYTGFRPQELATLRVSDVSLENGVIIGGMKSENGKNRQVPIHPEIMELVERRYKQSIDRFGGERLFNDARGQTGVYMTYDKYRRKFENVMKEMVWTGYSPHCTRHTFATQAKRSGMDSGIRKRIMGHSLKYDVTENVYTHHTLDDLKCEMEKIRFDI